MVKGSFVMGGTEDRLNRYMSENREANWFHTPQSLENEITHAIASGNVEKIKSMLSHGMSGNLGILSHDPERQIRYMFVTAAAVFARAAMRGGLDYELCCSMADTFCQQMDALHTFDRILSLEYEMPLAFAEKVRETKHARYSPLIESCCSHIYKHIHEPVRLEALAREHGMSTRGLSLRFRRETGLSVVDFINAAKMEEAENLLLHSGHAISEISAFLGFSSQSYFTSVFRKHRKVTPAVFRVENNGSSLNARE